MVNITLDDISPQLQFVSASNGWSQNHTADGDLPFYFGSTFHTTYTQGDYMSFTFNGSSIYIYGAKRANHGTFTAQLDGGDLIYLEGYVQPDTFQTILYQQGGLSLAQQHTVIVTNDPSANGGGSNDTYLDIDYVVVETGLNGDVYTSYFDDQSNIWQYSSSAWVSQVEPYFYNNTNHLAESAGLSVTLPFNGSAVQILGATNYNRGNYTVVLDGGPTLTYNGSAFAIFPNATLFTANNLTDGPHSVTLNSIGGGTSQGYLGIDWAVVNSSHPQDLSMYGSVVTTSNVIAAANSTGNSTGSSTDTGPGGAATSAAATSVSGKGTKSGAIAGGVVGGLVALAIISVMAWWCLRTRRRDRAERERWSAVDVNEDAHNFDGQEVQPFRHEIQRRAPSSSGRSDMPTASTSISGDREMSQTHQSFLSGLPPPPASNATSYPRSVGADSDYTSPRAIRSSRRGGSAVPSSGRIDPLSPSGTSVVPSSGQLDPDEPMSSGSSNPSRGTGSTKLAGAALPYTAQATLYDTPIANRYTVPGRDVDYGPLTESDTLLPPDYRQATQPLRGQRQ